MSRTQWSHHLYFLERKVEIGLEPFIPLVRLLFKYLYFLFHILVHCLVILLNLSCGHDWSSYRRSVKVNKPKVLFITYRSLRLLEKWQMLNLLWTQQALWLIGLLKVSSNLKCKKGSFTMKGFWVVGKRIRIATFQTYSQIGVLLKGKISTFAWLFIMTKNRRTAREKMELTFVFVPTLYDTK